MGQIQRCKLHFGCSFFTASRSVARPFRPSSLGCDHALLVTSPCPSKASRGPLWCLSPASVNVVTSKGVFRNGGIKVNIAWRPPNSRVGHNNSRTWVGKGFCRSEAFELDWEDMPATRCWQKTIKSGRGYYLNLPWQQPQKILLGTSTGYKLDYFKLKSSWRDIVSSSSCSECVWFCQHHCNFMLLCVADCCRLSACFCL